MIEQLAVNYAFEYFLLGEKYRNGVLETDKFTPTTIKEILSKEELKNMSDKETDLFIKLLKNFYSQIVQGAIKNN